MADDESLLARLADTLRARGVEVGRRTLSAVAALLPGQFAIEVRDAHRGHAVLTPDAARRLLDDRP